MIGAEQDFVGFDVEKMVVGATRPGTIIQSVLRRGVCLHPSVYLVILSGVD